MQNEENTEYETAEIDVEKKEKPVTCRGSFKLGTACGECARCQEAGYTVADKKAAEEAELERTKDFPADRVKKDDYVAKRTDEQREEDKQEIKEEIKEELKPELKEEIKEELKEEGNNESETV